MILCCTKELLNSVILLLHITKDRVKHDLKRFPGILHEPPRPGGFTLVEVMIVLSLIAILTSFAAPMFSRLIQGARISSGTNTFLSDMRFARSEAMRRGGSVVMCRSDSPEASEPVCATGTRAGGAGWARGWIVFQDQNNNGIRTPDAPLLRVQSAIATINAIDDSNVSSTGFRFTATGRLANANAAATLVFGAGPLFAREIRRTVCVSVGGNARSVGDGAATCAGNLL